MIVAATVLLLCASLCDAHGAATADTDMFFAALSNPSLPLFAVNKLDEMQKNCKSFLHNTVTTHNEEDSLHELIRILNTTKSDYEALNHFVYGWNTTMEYQYRANVQTVKRGVSLSRTFIIADDVLHDADQLNKLINIMQTQYNDGIKVFYGIQHDLEKAPEYHKYDHLDVGLSDDRVLARVTAVSVRGPQPAHVVITWDKDEIKRQNPFPFLKACRYIHPFDPSSKSRILNHLSKETFDE